MVDACFRNIDLVLMPLTDWGFSTCYLNSLRNYLKSAPFIVLRRLGGRGNKPLLVNIKRNELAKFLLPFAEKLVITCPSIRPFSYSMEVQAQ